LDFELSKLGKPEADVGDAIAYLISTYPMYRRMEIISPYLEEFGLTHIKNQDVMLRRLSNDMDITPLKTFVEVIEPLKGYSRHSQGVTYTQYSPYTRAVDAAVPDPKAARDFKNQVDTYLKTKDEASYLALKLWLTMWKENHASLLPIINGSPVLKEIESMSYDLSELSSAGLKALEMLHSGKPVPESFRNEQAPLVERAKKQRGQAELVIIPAFIRLFNLPEAKTPKYE
ncbi:MAG: hypothetical protein HF311_18380, partial [Ignavibacteria bacterium]|nr:hypothetical protein [Ignavibacteria bacterium]